MCKRNSDLIVFTMVLDVMPRIQERCCFALCPAHGGSNSYRKAGTCVPHFAVSHPIRHYVCILYNRSDEPMARVPKMARDIYCCP